MSWYDTIAAVKVAGTDGPRFVPGSYRVAVDGVREFKSPKDGGLYFIIDCLVLSSDVPAIPAGTVCGYAIRLDAAFEDYRAKAMAEVKRFLGAALGLDPRGPETEAQIVPSVVAGALQQPCPIRGHILNLRVWLKQPGPKAKPGSQPFAKAEFSPVTLGQIERHSMPALAAQASAPQASAPQAAPLTQAALVPPPIPGAPPALPPTPAWPPAGWATHPQNPAFFYSGNRVLSEADLRALVAQGKA